MLSRHVQAGTSSTAPQSARPVTCRPSSPSPAGTYTAAEIGIDDSNPLDRPTSGIARRRWGGLFTRMKGGYYHDGRFADLRAVVDHYSSTFNLNLSERQKRELIEYLKSL